jgi:peptide/nickel transport system substrate-binding protein
VAIEDETDGFDPTLSRFDNGGVIYARAVFDPLAIVDSKGNVVPYLAESITPNQDYTVWTIKARSNINFHDGTPFDANAMKQNFDAMKAGPYGFIASAFGSVSLIDSMTVQLSMLSPWVPFDYWLTGFIGGQMAYMASPKMLNKQDGYGPSHPSGTGPFVFESWIPNESFKAKANKNYWRKGLPYVDSITIKPIVDPNTRVSSLQSGTIDLAHFGTGQPIAQLIGSQNISRVSDAHLPVGEPDITMTMLNCYPTKAPFNNIYARQALAYATDTSRYISTVGGNIELPTDSIFSPGTPFYTKTTYPQYSLDKAKQAVANYKKSTGASQLSFILGTTNDAIDNQWAQLMASMWEQAGINVNINTSYLTAQLIGTALSGQYDAFLWRQFGSIHPDLNYIFWDGNGMSENFALDFARMNDPLTNQYLQSAREEKDSGVAAQYYQKVSERFAVDLQYIYTSRAVWNLAAYGNVQNYNNPTTVDGKPALGMLAGMFFVTEIWKG